MWDLSFWQNLPQIFNYGLSIAPGKFVGRNLEQIQVEGCKLSVCVQLHFGANFALIAKYYSPRDTSSASHISTVNAIEKLYDNTSAYVFLNPWVIRGTI